MKNRATWMDKGLHKGFLHKAWSREDLSRPPQIQSLQGEETKGRILRKHASLLSHSGVGQESELEYKEQFPQPIHPEYEVIVF
jgi:hypothetical protein